MPYWIKEPTLECLKSALEKIYFAANLKRTVVNSYPDGKNPVPIGPESTDEDWDKIIADCEHLGLRPSIISLAGVKTIENDVSIPIIDDQLRNAITQVYDDGSQNWDHGDGWPPRFPEIRTAYELVRQLTKYHVNKPKSSSCRHKETTDGKPITRLHGSYKTKICVKCGRVKRFTWLDEPVGRWGYVDPKEYEPREDH